MGMPSSDPIPAPCDARRRLTTLSRMHSRGHWSTQDLALCTAVSALTFVYLVFIWPKILVQLDEGPFIYEAKRILDGEVMYRDFFDLTGPLSQHAMALMYLVAGVSMETARGGTALLHAIIVALAYAVMRRLGVRPMLAAVCCLADLAWFFPAFAMATAHWFSTTFAMIVYWFVARAPLVTRKRAAIAGALTSLVALTQQPKGVGSALAVCFVLLFDVWHDRQHRPFRTGLVQQLGVFGVTLGAIVVLVLGAMMAIAGFWPVFDAIVITPLGPYRDIPMVSEGRWLPLFIDRNLWWHMLTTASTFLLLNLMPLIVVVAALRWLVRQFTATNGEDQRPSFVAVIFGASAIVSVLYLPNHSHFAIVGPLWLPLYGELFERLIRRGERALHGTWVGPVGVAVVFALLALRVGHDLPRAWAGVAATDRSAFGAIDFTSQGEVADVVAVRDAITAAGATDIFVYPSAAALYLMTETSNPTRFQLLMPDYNTAAQFAEVQEVLERERVPFVVRTLYLWGNKDDPAHDRLLPYLSDRYELVPLPRLKGAFPTLTLFRRKADEPDTKPVAF
jgi:hypothetical protein